MESSAVIPSAEVQRGQQVAPLEAYPTLGTTFKGRYKGKDVAVKKLRLQQENAYFTLGSWKDEVAKLARLNDVYVARFLGVIEDSDWSTVYEWVEGSDLGTYLKKNHPEGASSAFASRTGTQIAEGLRYLHQNDVLHLSLSPGNIIISSSGNSLRLKDFGLRSYKLAADADRTTHGNPRYAALELIMRQHEEIGTQSDVWSLGMVLYEILVGHPPFKGYQPPQVARKIWEAHERPDLDDVKDNSFRRLLEQCWEKRPSSRPNLPSLISSLRSGASSSSSSSTSSSNKPASADADKDLDDLLADLDKVDVK